MVGLYREKNYDQGLKKKLRKVIRCKTIKRNVEKRFSIVPVKKFSLKCRVRLNPKVTTSSNQRLK